jgi:chemotaxis protein histidine kinase CheA
VEGEPPPERAARPDLDAIRSELEAAFERELDWRVPALAAAVAELHAPADLAGAKTSLGALATHAHSIKGGAMLVGRLGLASLAEAIESRADWLIEHPDEVSGLIPALEAAVASIGRSGPAEPLEDDRLDMLIDALKSRPKAP